MFFGSRAIVRFPAVKNLAGLQKVINKEIVLKRMAANEACKQTSTDKNFDSNRQLPEPAERDRVECSAMKERKEISGRPINTYFNKVVEKRPDAAAVNKTDNLGSTIAEVPPQVRRVPTNEFHKVVFDLETSSRGDDTEIVQIAATDGRDHFNVYVLPQNGITHGASAVNNLRMNKGMLFHGKKRISAVKQSKAMVQFLMWLKLKTPCLLIAHNAKTFDAKHLTKALADCSETKEFSQKVIGFSDTLTAFRELYPGRKSFSQPNLAKDLLSMTYNAHNALDDVNALYQLVSKFLTTELLVKHSFTVSWFNEYQSFMKTKNKNLRSLAPLISSGKLSASMANKMATSGLHYDQLCSVYQGNGEDGLRNMLTEKHDGKPRVTANEKVLAQFCSFFTETLQLDEQKCQK